MELQSWACHQVVTMTTDTILAHPESLWQFHFLYLVSSLNTREEEKKGRKKTWKTTNISNSGKLQKCLESKVHFLDTKLWSGEQSRILGMCCISKWRGGGVRGRAPDSVSSSLNMKCVLPSFKLRSQSLTVLARQVALQNVRHFPVTSSSSS